VKKGEEYVQDCVTHILFRQMLTSEEKQEEAAAPETVEKEVPTGKK